MWCRKNTAEECIDNNITINETNTMDKVKTEQINADFDMCNTTLCDLAGF